MNQAENFRKTVRNKFKFKMFMLKELPSAFFSGITVTEITEEKAVVTIPFKFLTKNPFKSMYFASQAMAAELSTGVLALSQIHKRKPSVSMLVFDMDAHFSKKATTIIAFTCNEGLKIKQAVEETMRTGEGVTVIAKSQGIDKFGDVVSEFNFTWTFKAKI
jgi:hypothetical protein